MEGFIALSKCLNTIIAVLIKNNLVTKEEFLEITKKYQGDLTDEEMLKVVNLIGERLNNLN